MSGARPASVRSPLLCAALAAAAFSASCRRGIVPANAVMHPTEENLPAAGGPLIRADTVLSGVSDPQRAADWAAARRAILDAETVTSIGALGGDGPDVLGIVGAAAVDGEGNVYVQENTSDEILVFSASGDLLHRTGGTGDGPEEFRAVRRFVRLSDGRLVVAHGGTPKVLSAGDEGYRYAGPLLEDQGTEAAAIIDMCAAGDRLFLHAANLGSADAEAHRVVREVSVDERRVTASLAPGYRSEFEEDRQSRSYGSIACGSDPATVVWSTYYFPIVKGYLQDNTLLWTALVEDFEQGLIYQNNARSPTVHPVRGLQEYITGVHALNPGFVVLQTLLRGRLSDEGVPVRQVLRRRTYLIDRESGNGGLVGDDLPWIGWVGDSSFVVVASEPYPKLEVRALPGR